MFFQATKSFVPWQLSLSLQIILFCKHDKYSITVPLIDVFASTKNFAFLRYERGCKNKKKIADYKICKFFANASYVRPPSKDALCPFSIAMNTALAIVWYGQTHCTCIGVTQKLTPGHAISLNHGFLIGVGIVHRYEVYISILRWREGIWVNYRDRCICYPRTLPQPPPLPLPLPRLDPP